MDSSSDSYDEEELQDIVFSEIRSNLNIDSETLDDAWNSYRRLSAKFNLEKQGKKIEWIACALYAACRRCLTPIGRGKEKIEGNMISLTRILRSCNISLGKFFVKIKNWIEMADLPIEMRKKVDQIEKNFSVTSVIFKKFKPLFEDIFHCPIPPSRFNPKNRKIRKYQPLNSIDVFTFCWTLFVFIKSKFSQIGDDLVNSYHLLLVCVDYCFSSVLSFDNYKDIINTNFYDMLTKKFGKDLRSLNNENRVSIIDTLCEKYNGLPLEVNHIRLFWFKVTIDKLIKNDHLRKGANGIIDCNVIDHNYKYLKKEYEDFVLTIGDFDECIFLNESASEELGTSELSTGDIDKKLLQHQQQQQQMFSCENNDNNLVPATPLSSKQYLASRTPVKKVLTPISSATTSISRLHVILTNHTNVPSQDLQIIFEKCENNPSDRIKGIVEKMGEIFQIKYAKYNQEQSVIKSTDEFNYIHTSNDEFATKRLKFAETFFYYILEKLLKSELKRTSETQKVQTLSKTVSSDLFISSLFVCSLEIILFSYNLCKKIFPWILQIYDDHPQLKIPPFFFYKIIELIIREEPGLSRDIVKHLNTIEEKILDNLAWTSDSPIWIHLSKISPPTCAEVSLSLFGPSIDINNSSSYQDSIMSPVTKIKAEVNNSTTPAMITVFPKNDCKRKLFVDPVSKNLTVNQVKPEETNKILSKQEETNENESMQTMATPSTPVKNLKNTPINLFFRKVYNIASLRLRDLCKRLQITSEEILIKIWTCLEHALQNHTYLMCDHHLDQLIMCSIYGITRINTCGEKVIRFEDILNVYRLQPQASNLVYRNVLLFANKKKLSSTNVQQSDCGNISSATEANNLDQVKYGTIIDFYNKIFIPNLTQAYIMKFCPNERSSSVKLSPMPRSKLQSPNLNSPLRCVPNYPVFVSPLRSNYKSPNKQLYNTNFNNFNSFNTSQDFENLNNIMKKSRDINAAINNLMVSNARRVSKRILQDDDTNNSFPNKVSPTINRLVREIMCKRKDISGQSSNVTSANVSDESNDSTTPSSQSSYNNNLNIKKLSIQNNNNSTTPIPSPTIAIINNTGIDQMNNNNEESGQVSNNSMVIDIKSESPSSSIQEPQQTPQSQAVSVIQTNGCEIGAFVH